MLALLARSQGARTRLESFLCGRLPPRILKSALAVLHKFAEGLQMTRSRDDILKLCLLSLFSWLIANLSMWCYLRAFHLAVPWQAATLVLVVTNLGAAIPSSPGAIGIYEFLTILALSVWLPDRSMTLAFAAVVHSVNLALSVTLGLAVAWHEGVQLSKLVACRAVAAESNKQGPDE